MTSWVQQDLFLVYSRWTRGYWALRLTLGRPWASVRWGPGREPGARLSRKGNQAPYSLSKALLTRSSGQPGKVWSILISPKSNWASPSAFLKASDHPHCSTESVIWGLEAPVSGCSWVTWDGIDVAPNQPRPPYRLAFQWHPPERKHSPSRAVLRSMHAGQWFQDSLLLYRLQHLLDGPRRSTRELFRQGLTHDSNPRFHHVRFHSCQEKLFLIDPTRFLPLLRHMILIVGLWMRAATMLRDPRLATELTTAVRAW